MDISMDGWDELFLFYNKMAARGYAGNDVKPEQSREFPGAKLIVLHEDGLTYRDQWQTGSMGKLEVSYGHTELSINDVPVWVLSYFGWHDKSDPRVIETLKEALLFGYSTGNSRGGRGPDLFSSKDGGYTYENTIKYGTFDGGIILPSHFESEPQIKVGKLNFSLVERIYRKEKPSVIPAYEVFRHDLSGFALIN